MLTWSQAISHDDSLCHVCCPIQLPLLHMLWCMWLCGYLDMLHKLWGGCRAISLRQCHAAQYAAIPCATCRQHPENRGSCCGISPGPVCDHGWAHAVDHIAAITASWSVALMYNWVHMQGIFLSIIQKGTILWQTLLIIETNTITRE